VIGQCETRDPHDASDGLELASLKPGQSEFGLQLSIPIETKAGTR
jgi:hypothetical protein